ncbi:MAG: Rrf2 family transcriptional regulator [Candidatus Omnitrophota bacterium]
MLSLSQTAGYAILALSCLNDPDEEWVLEKTIANETGIARPYLSKILYGLARAGLIVSKRGYKGGLTLARPAIEISILDVSNAVDGDEWWKKCLLGLPQCSDERPCPIHDFWAAIRPKIVAKFQSFSLAEVREFRKRGWRLS